MSREPTAAFGLEDYPSSYPASHRVKDALYGPRGALKRGLIRSLGNGLYEVTEKGRLLRGDAS
jgi:hypothetical protein